MITCWHRVPLLGQGHHGTRIEDTEPKEVIELQANPIHCPVESVLGIEQRIALRCQHSQMLNVAPSQLRAVCQIGFQISINVVFDKSTNSQIHKSTYPLTLPPRPMQRRLRLRELRHLFPNALSYTCHTGQWWQRQCWDPWHHC